MLDKYSEKELNIFFLILLIIIFLGLILPNKWKNKFYKNQIYEGFIEGNINLCKLDDCDCLKLNTAPNGRCVAYEIAKKPLPPEYENKKLFDKNIVINNLYPKKRPQELFIFVGSHIRNKKSNYSYVPNIIQFMKKTEYGVYSEDEATEHFYDIFKNVTDILERFELSNGKPYLKYIILDVNNISIDRKIMASYKIDHTDFPAFYLYNEKTGDAKKFIFKKKDDRCKILEDLMIFLANGDCGFISYLNHITDPHSGIRYLHNSDTNEWLPHKKGFKMLEYGTNLCRLIHHRDLNKSFDCKKNDKENKK